MGLNHQEMYFYECFPLSLLWQLVAWKIQISHHSEVAVQTWGSLTEQDTISSWF